MKTWRDVAAPIIARVIHEHIGEPEKAVRAALRDAYPWGERANHPYHVWCSEIRKQLSIDGRLRGQAIYTEHVDAGQMEMFPGDL